MKVFSLFFLIISSFCFSQISEEEQIKATINDLFLGMRTSDPVLVRRSLTKGATFHSLDMDGKFYTDSPEQFSEQIGKAPKGSLDEKATSWKSPSTEKWRMLGFHTCFITKTLFRTVA